MKKLLILIVLVFSCHTIYAQDVQDIVHLKNGSVIRGLIVEQVPGESIKLQTADGNLFVYKMAEVAKITKEQEVSQSATKSVRQSGQKGYEGSVEVLGGVQVDPILGAHRVQISTIQGYRFNPYFYLGLGLGYQYNITNNGSFLPIFAHARVNFMKTKIAPFFSLDLGYALSLNEQIGDMDLGGLVVNPMVGVKFKLRGHSDVLFAVGYHLQSTLFVSNNRYGDYKIEPKLSGALSFKLGFTF